ncbi:hypothetical protein D3C71_1798420 [compost metagenome]
MSILVRNKQQSLKLNKKLFLLLKVVLIQHQVTFLLGQMKLKRRSQKLNKFQLRIQKLKTLSQHQLLLLI